jgi:cytochrome c peroxidase
MKQILVLFLLIFILYAFRLREKSTNIGIAKIELGHYLFFEKRLSKTLSKSCSSCHDPKFAFSDGYRRPLGIYADELAHNTPSLINAVEYKSLNWANPDLHNFEQQMLRPLFGKQPVEMGNDDSDTSTLKQFANDVLYKKLYQNAFPNQKEVFTWKNTIIAIAEYVKNIRSKNSPYDSFLVKKTTLSLLQKEGYDLFFSKKTKCYTCHKGDFFSDSKFYSIDKVSEKKIRTPSLRNVALTSPYMHDGSVATISEAVGICQQYKGKKKLTTPQKTAIVNFLYTLTDSTIFKNSLFNDPF